jgi:hypothetical protein
LQFYGLKGWAEVFLGLIGFEVQMVAKDVEISVNLVPLEVVYVL